MLSEKENNRQKKKITKIKNERRDITNNLKEMKNIVRVYSE